MLEGGAEAVFDVAPAFRAGHGGALILGDIEGVDGGALFGADSGEGDVEAEVGEGIGEVEEQADAVGSLDLDDRAVADGGVVEGDAGGDGFEAGEEGRGGVVPVLGDEAGEVQGFAPEGAGEEIVEAFPCLACGDAGGLGIGHEEGIEDRAVRAGEDAGAEDVEGGGGEGAGDTVEEARAVPGADFEDGVTAVRFGVPGDDGVEDATVRGELVPHEPMGEADIAGDFAG